MSHMIDQPLDYFRQFVSERDPLLRRLEVEAAQKEIPIIGPLVGELLYLLVRVTGAKKILEIGTATGYSGIFLTRAAVQNSGFLTTLEWESEMAESANTNFTEAGLSKHVEIHVGDARALMKDLGGPYDFIFVDIDKQYYENILSDCRRLLKSGGLMVVDNTGFADADTFNRKIFSLPEWRVVNLYAFLPYHSPENDGLCFALAV